MYIVLALLCMTLHAIQEIMSKKVSNQDIKLETMFINTYLFLGVFKVLLIIVTVGSSFIFRPLMLLLIIPNIIVCAAINYLYLKALKMLPVSVVVPIYLIYYPISMLFSIGLLKEQVSSTQLIAMVVIFVMILMLSISTSKNRLNKGINKEHYEESHKKLGVHLKSISKGILYIVTAGLLNAVSILLDKNAYNVGITTNEMILYSGISNIIIAFIFYYIIKKSFNVKGNKYLYTMTSLMIMTIGVKFLSSITYIASMQMGNATIVVPITASSILLVELLSSFFLKEKLRKREYLYIAIFMIAILVLII
ncbi:MAG: EamA family transporter [Clostridia bacterium]|nr:EamA family transporter [Clostridia bacterium]MDD4386987.1 EamA family transporter [Clostridia bacterium]